MTYPTDQAIEDFVEEATSWRPIDIGDALRRRDPATAAVMRRTDGVGLLYPGRVHWLLGEPESGKSMIAHHAAAEALAANRRVLMIDFDSDECDVATRLLDLGRSDVDLIDRLDYIRPCDPFLDPNRRLTSADASLRSLMEHNRGRYGLVVLDGVTEALALEGLNMNDNTDVTWWTRSLPKMLAAETGAPVIVIDHVTKSSESRGRYPIGAQAKLAAVDGAAYRVEVRTPIARAADTTRQGTVVLTIQKDRPGYVRRTADGKTAAVATVTSYPDQSIRIDLDPATGHSKAHGDIQRSIVDYLHHHDGASKRELETGVTGNAERIRAALDGLVDDGVVRVDRHGRGHRHHLTGLAYPNEPTP